LAVEASERSLNISTNRYKGGVTTYLEVLTAQTAQLSNERTQADIATRQFVASVQLIRALGGGWDTGQLPKL
jgi:outer membrane protein TolC